MSQLPRVLLAVALAAVLFLVGCATKTIRTSSYEVWAIDQNQNILYVLNPDGKVLRTVDEATLGNAKRPHMLYGVNEDEYLYTANSVSNSVTVFSNRDGMVKAVIPNVGKLPHAAQPNPKRPDRVYVMNIAPQGLGPDGKPDKGESITEIIRLPGPRWEIGRYLDLKAEPILADTHLYPSARAVCAGFTDDGRYMMVTLFNGGIGVVDLDEWRVVKGWDKNQIYQYGCGFASSPDEQRHVASPSGREIYVTAGDERSSWLYVIDITGEPELVASHDLSSVGQDAHGVAIDPVRNTLWVVHRVSSNVTIHPLSTIRQANHTFGVIDFVGKTPDLVALSPDYRRAYISLRGPKPAPTIPHATVGETPGISIVDVEKQKLLAVVKLGDQELGDFHGIFIPQTQMGFARH